MDKISYNKIDLDVYNFNLDNGLRVFLSKIPRNEIHARMTVLYGGATLEFKAGNEYTKVPAGIAHFLEHKMFEKKDFDPFQIYENNGASANAYTNEKVTSYLFTGSNNFYENLNTLLRCVSEPYFTDENVEKEKGIISQEKKADLDDPYYIVRDKAYENTFKNSGYKYTVLGSLEEIGNMTKEDLYKVYNTFYQPNNMILTISGGIDIEKTEKFIKDFYSKKNFEKNKKILKKKIEEPETVVKEKEIIYKDNVTKEIFINYKIKKQKGNEYNEIVYLNLFLDMNFGGLSELCDITFKDKNFLSPIRAHMINTEEYYILQFSITVKKETDKVIELIDKTLKTRKLDKKIFNLLKKNSLSSLVLSSENTQKICSIITNDIVQHGHLVTDKYDRLYNLDFKEFEKFIESLNLENRCIVTLEPKKGD